MSTQIQLLKKYGLPVRGRLGQHLLIDPNLQRKIVDALEIEKGDYVFEIGPGLGALTELILQKGARVWAIEKDERFAEILRGELEGDYRDQLTVICQDILKFKFAALPALPKKMKWKIVSNLPYYITAPILFFLIDARQFISKAVLMMQKEVAERLNAIPGNKSYGRLTLGVRYSADVRHLFDVAATCFTPPPEVDSSVLELTFRDRPKLPAGIRDEDVFHVIQIAFSQRRKTLFRLVRDAFKKEISKPELEDIFKRLKLNEKIRGEDLLLKDFIELTARLQQANIDFGGQDRFTL